MQFLPQPRLSRRAFLGTACGAAFAQGAKPNIVLILADDLGWADLGCYGADLHQTPHLDQLAREGMRFTNALAAAPICSPTRAALLTGKHPVRLGFTIWHEGAVATTGIPQTNRKLVPPAAAANLPHAETTLAEHLQRAGYRTALVGKWHLGTAEFAPETQGFEDNAGGTHWGAPSTFFYPYRGTQRFNGEYRYVPGLGYGKPGDYLTDRLTDKAIEAIDGAAGQPFFLYLAHHAQHTPIEAPAGLVAKYKALLRSEHKHRNVTYAAMVESLDASVGRIRAHLKARGLDRNTLFVFTSDNGGYINVSEGEAVTTNAPLRSGKGSLYEGGLRIPLLVHWPGVTRAGAVSAEPVVTYDLFATAVAAAGVAGVAAHDGLNLRPLFDNPQTRLPREEYFFHYPHYYPTTTPVTGLRTREWKLLHYYEDNRIELYNLRDDPAESRNVYDSHPEVVARLRERLTAWQRDTGAREPKPARQ
jgi:arylsulfatase A